VGERVNAAMATKYRLGVDVGGTHTDLVLLDVGSGSIAVEKVSTTPANPALGIMRGIGNFASRGVDLSAIEFFSHGTTITTNALLEMRGAKVGLLINRGFRAVQETQGQARDGNPFDYFYQKPIPIAPQSLTREVGGRIDYSGAELEPLDEDAVRDAAAALKAAGVASIAVCYLFSFMNPAHERRTGALVREVFPQAHISLSCEVLSRVREWPRLSATLLNAYLAPVLVTYIADLEKRLNAAGLTTQQRFLMQSNGGVMPFLAAVTGYKTVHSLLSGPAAGAQASAHMPHESARGLVTLDMGGTSCDIAFIEGGAPLEVTEGTVARRQLDVPALDLTTISAGGGSIVWIDRAGFLSVGPQSAGADPGPVCYGRGGENPTVTDADIVCGFLNPDYLKLDAEAARAALEARIARPMRMTVTEAAAGVRRIVDTRMADEVRVFAARRGVDLGEFALLPFGGAGAVHAAAVAEELGMRRIIVPARPGTFSALGLLCTDVLHDYIRSELGSLDQLDPARAEKIFRDLETKAAAELADEGLNPSDAVFERDLDMRYAGQGYELRVPLSGLWRNALDNEALAAARTRFDDVHERIHGHAAKEKSAEVVSYRLRVRVSVPKFSPQPQPQPASPAAPPSPQAVKGTRHVFFAAQQPTETTIYDRERLGVGASFAGPAIVEQFDATSVVPPGWHASVDRFGNLMVERKG
jgi:N-methylhydantoinase A